MKKIWILFIFVLICLAAFVFIIRSQTQNKISIPAFVKLPGKPERIVSLSPNLTEILFALGLDEKIAAISSDSDYPAQASGRKKIGTFWQPNTEAIIAAKPDLVITELFEQQKAVANSLNKLGYQVLTLKVEKIEELLTAIRKIGEAAGCTQQANALAENVSNQLNNLQSKVSSLNKVKVLWVLQVEPLRVAGRTTFINELIELTGGENAIGPTIQQYPPISTEEILTCGAQVIIQSAMGSADIAGQQKAAEKFWSKFTNLPAVKNNRIYVVNPDTILRLGPRIPHGAEIIARCLHPDIFNRNTGTAQR